MHRIGIVLLATNAYFVLGVRFIKKFMHHYKGDCEIKFYFFSDEDPAPYLQENTNVEFHFTKHNNWVDGTNSKFSSIISLENCDSDYLYYFDADTNISRNFTEQWFLGDLVGGEHYGNKSWLKNGAGFDKNPNSQAYVPNDTPFECTYYYGAFFGGLKDIVINFCKVLREWQLLDKKIPYEPVWNDESYINAYFHYHPPSIVFCKNFMFDVSDKGGIGETRRTNLDIESLKAKLIEYKNDLVDIKGGTVCKL